MVTKMKMFGYFDNERSSENNNNNNKMKRRRKKRKTIFKLKNKQIIDIHLMRPYEMYETQIKILKEMIV